jgi:hypothetical protein
MAKHLNISEKNFLKSWQLFCENFKKSATVDYSETEVQKAKRILKLEANAEKWFKYYFPNYCSSEPADFHKAHRKAKLMDAPDTVEGAIFKLNELDYQQIEDSLQFFQRKNDKRL